MVRCDALLQRGAVVPMPVESSGVKVAPGSALEAKVRSMVGGAHDTDTYINAIRIVRCETGMYLKEAKSYVDEFRHVQAA